MVRDREGGDRQHAVCSLVRTTHAVDRCRRNADLHRAREGSPRGQRRGLRCRTSASAMRNLVKARCRASARKKNRSDGRSMSQPQRQRGSTATRRSGPGFRRGQATARAAPAAGCQVTVRASYAGRCLRACRYRFPARRRCQNTHDDSPIVDRRAPDRCRWSESSQRIVPCPAHHRRQQQPGLPAHARATATRRTSSPF